MDVPGGGAVRSVVAATRRALGSPWLRPLNDADTLDDVLALANPLWSVRARRAEVVGVVDETADTRTFVLRPNRRWEGFLAGQHVCVEVEIDGVRHQRAYSLSSRPAGPTIAVTVKRHPGGRVSGFLHDAVRPGHVLGLGPASGRFVLPDPAPARLLMLSAGSGITPIMSILRDLHARRRPTDVVLVHSCRAPEDAIFRRELAARAREWPALRLAFVFTGETGRLDRGRLVRLVPDWDARTTFLCGPPTFMDMVRSIWRDGGVEGRLREESFTGPVVTGRPGAHGTATVTCARSGVAFAAARDRPLLVEAERAGLRPRHGCRMGICHTCVCRKVSGTVENLVTGAVSSEPDAMIQICVSAARSDLTLAL
jgi:ferredoxin-NADP reductase